MTSVIATSSPPDREHLRLMCAPTRALSQIVLNLTKPNDKIRPIDRTLSGATTPGQSGVIVVKGYSASSKAPGLDPRHLKV